MLTSYAIAFAAMLGTVLCYPEGRVVNGTATAIRKYPFMVSLRTASGAHSCGASIIAPRWILTAAHCVNGRTPSQVSIQFAASIIDRRGAHLAQVKRFVIHENYKPSGAYINDIALVELQNALVYDYIRIAPVALPDANFEVPQTELGAVGVLLGWGLNATGGVYMATLQEVTLKIFSDSECSTRHDGDTNANHLCAGVDEGGKGQCTGDSGGPLLYKGSIQLGIVSWSIKPCGIKYYPGVFTKVSHFVGWIRQHVDAVV